MDLKFVLANALVANPGSKVIIPCYNDKDAESIRVRLFRLRNLIPVGKHLVSIKKRTQEGSPVIILERTGPPLEIDLPSQLKTSLLHRISTGWSKPLSRMVQPCRMYWICSQI